MPTSRPSDGPGDREEAPTPVTDDVLRRWPLPQAGEADDKNDRGLVLVVGGSAEVPGSVLLAGLGALRSGAGKLQLATSRSVATALAVAVPEARVVGLPEGEDGAVAGSAAGAVARLAESARAVVLGPGMADPAAVQELLGAVVGACAGSDGPILVLDAVAISGLAGEEGAAVLAPLGGRVLLTPNAGEAARMLGCDPAEVEADPLAMAQRLARGWGAVVALKGPTTFTASPDGRAFVDKAGNAGLGTSGSGDVLAGVVGGLAARGAEPLQSAVWGVHVHALAGDRLVQRIGPVGYLARELLDEVPLVLACLAT